MQCNVLVGRAQYRQGLKGTYRFITAAVEAFSDAMMMSDSFNTVIRPQLVRSSGSTWRWWRGWVEKALASSAAPLRRNVTSTCHSYRSESGTSGYIDRMAIFSLSHSLIKPFQWQHRNDSTGIFLRLLQTIQSPSVRKCGLVHHPPKPLYALKSKVFALPQRGSSNT